MIDDQKIRYALMKLAYLGKFSVFNKVLNKHPLFQYDSDLITSLIFIADTTTRRESALCLYTILNKNNVNLVNKYGDTPLLSAVKFCGKVSIPIIGKVGADLELTDAKGLTALDHAMLNLKLPTMAYLVSRNARINSCETFQHTLQMIIHYYIQNPQEACNLATINHIKECWKALERQHKISIDKLESYCLQRLTIFAKKAQEIKTPRQHVYLSCIIS